MQILSYLVRWVDVSPPAREKKSHDVWWEWLERAKGISKEEYLKLPETEKKRLRDEWVEWMMRWRGQRGVT